MRHDFRPAAILDGPTFRSDTIDLYWKISIFFTFFLNMRKIIEEINSNLECTQERRIVEVT